MVVMPGRWFKLNTDVDGCNVEVEVKDPTDGANFMFLEMMDCSSGILRLGEEVGSLVGRTGSAQCPRLLPASE